MRLLNDRISGILKALVVSSILFAFHSELVNGQQNTSRASRYRLADDTNSKPDSQKKPAFVTGWARTNNAARLEFEDAAPETDLKTKPLLLPKLGNQTGSSENQFDGSWRNSRDLEESSVEQAAYSVPNKSKKQDGWISSAESWGEASAYDSSSAYFDRFAEPTRFPFTDQFRAFPPRAGYDMQSGQPGSGGLSRCGSSDLFGVHENQCCDPWSGFCPCVAADYKCGCGGLKANPGHCLFKRCSSGEPCDQSYGSSFLSRCRCGKQDCTVNDCRPRKSSCGCGSKSKSGCGSGKNSSCGSRSTGCGQSSDCGCGPEKLLTPTQRRCPLVSSLKEKCKLGESRPINTVGQTSCSCASDCGCGR